jgi:ankyrin repeat protein
VGIVAKELEKYTCDEVKDALISFPQGLFQLYGRILLQIPLRRRTSTAKILQWVVMAARPLTLRELGAVLGLADNASPGLTCEAAALEQVKNCGHLLMITRRKFHHEHEVRFIHQSAKEYLLRETCDPNPDLESLRIKKEVANYQIAKQCLDYLQGDALAHGYVDLYRDQRHLKAFPLLDYATLHWFEHARCLSDPDLDVFDLSLPFYADPSPVREAWLRTFYLEQEYSLPLCSSSLLHVTSCFGIVPLAEKLLCGSTKLEYQRLETKDKWKGWTPLHWAAKSGHEAIVRLLLVKGADPEAKDYEGRTVLFQAAQLKNQKITQLLLYRGVNVNAQDKIGQTALHQAAQNQNETAVQLLLKHKADPNVKDGDEQTALHLAAPTGKAVVQLLLEHKADPNAKNKERRTALHIASLNEVVIKILLEHRADPHARDRYGQTAWHFAIEHGYGKVIQLFIRHGADLNARDEYGQTLLHLATWHGHEKVIQTLIEHGADLNARDEYGQTLLHLATWHGHEKVKKLLIEHGADPNARDRHGRTALQLAIDLEGGEGVPQSEFSHAKASQREAIMRMLRDVTAANSKDERQMRYPDLEDVVSRVEQALSSSHLIGGSDDDDGNDDGNDNDNDSDPIVIGQGSVAWHVLSDACRPEH